MDEGATDQQPNPARRAGNIKPPLNLKRSFLAAALLIGAVTFAGFCFKYIISPPPWRSRERVVAINVSLYPWGQQQKAFSAKITDERQIKSLVDVLRRAERTKDHKCGASGGFLFEMKDGSQIEIRILAGHKTEFYAYRVFYGKNYSNYEIFRVNRAAFERAMKDIGVEELDQGSPE